MLKKANTGLVVVDIQGKLAGLVHDSETLIANCEKLIKGAQVLGLPIVWLEQNPDKLGPTVEPLASLLNTSSAISKFAFNACDEAKFIDAIGNTGVDTWLVCGIEAHICVYQTALGLQQLDFNVQLISDCISSRTLANKQLAINKLVNKGIDITGVEMCLYELVKDCRTAEFKQILKLVR
ncbi:MAG: isochorismatase family protein [Psychromonas sp.]